MSSGDRAYRKAFMGMALAAVAAVAIVGLYNAGAMDMFLPSMLDARPALEAVAGKEGCACCSKKQGEAIGTPAEGVDQEKAARIAAAREMAAAYYIKATGDREFTVEAEDFGCHQEAAIIKNGGKVMGLRVQNGETTPL